ncbi:hypothetical protein HY487_00685, partial [Candidatus Woesearchaeota archaeon]|nr:hypothetical protein [Candidatus Woesearchaeota archaeon]
MEKKNIVQKKPLKQVLFDVYDKKYKLLLIIPFLVLFLAMSQIAYQVYTTGDFIRKDVSLKGGVTITIPLERALDAKAMEERISPSFPGNDIGVRTLGSAGNVVGIIVEADINGNDDSQVQALLNAIQDAIGADMAKIDYGIEIIGSSLGASFFRESLIALAVAFLFMGLVVFIYFRTFIPSVAVVLAAFSDMVVALAVINLLGIKIGTAGIAAFLMLIGYSVDT